MELWDQRKLIHLAILKLLVPDVDPARGRQAAAPRRGTEVAHRELCHPGVAGDVRAVVVYTIVAMFHEQPGFCIQKTYVGIGLSTFP